MTWKSQPVGHADLREAQSGWNARSLAWLPPTWRCLEPGLKESSRHRVQLVNKPNTVGKMKRSAEDAAVSIALSLCSSCSCSSTSPLFPLGSARNGIPPPSFLPSFCPAACELSVNHAAFFICLLCESIGMSQVS